MKISWDKLRQGARDVAAEVQRQVRHDVDLVKGEVEQVDWDKVGDDLSAAGQQAKSMAAQAAQRTGAFVSDARAAWTAHGAEASASAAAADALQTVAEAPDSAEARGILSNMPPEELQQGLEQLTVRWRDAHGPEAAEARLDALDQVLEAARTVQTAHDQRARSVPRHQGRPDAVDPRLAKAVGALRDAVDGVRAQLRRAPQPDLYAATSGASEGLWKGGEQVFARAAKWVGQDGAGSGIGAAVSQARERLGSTLEKASPAWLKTRYESAKASIATATEQAETILGGLDGLEAEATDKAAMLARFEAVLEHARNATDPSADAVGVGFLKEAAGGATGGRGKELVYIRETGELRVVDLEMSGARLAVGASKRPFARSVYGDAGAIARTDRRHVGEVGAMIFHVGSGRSNPDAETGDPVRSWHGTLGVGFNASLPLVGDQSVYSIREKTLASHALSEADQARIEAQLEQIPKASQRWTGFVRDMVGHRSARAPDAE